MGAYRLYLLDAKGAIQARQDFVTDSDTEAMTTGSLLWRSCADCYPGYELWKARAASHASITTMRRYRRRRSMASPRICKNAC